MSTHPLSKVVRARTRAARWLAACAAVVLMLPSLGHAQAATRVRYLTSGLHWLPEGATTSVTVSDAGVPSAAALVWLEVRDAGGRLLAGKRGAVDRATPLNLRFENRTGAGMRQVSVFVSISIRADAGNAPITVWEDIGPGGLAGNVRSCGPGALRGGAQEMCEGFLDETSEQ